MSRIGRQPITVPAGVTVSIEPELVERLLPGSGAEGGPVAHALQPCLQVQARQLICTGRRSPALEQVRRQQADRGLQRAARDVTARHLLDGIGNCRGLGHRHCRQGCRKRCPEPPQLTNCNHVPLLRVQTDPTLGRVTRPSSVF